MRATTVSSEDRGCQHETDGNRGNGGQGFEWLEEPKLLNLNGLRPKRCSRGTPSNVRLGIAKLFWQRLLSPK